MKIRKIGIQDIDKLKEIGELTFSETFADINSEENMSKYFESAFSTKRLKD